MVKIWWVIDEIFFCVITIAVAVIVVLFVVVHIVVVVIAIVNPRNLPLKFGENRVSNS